MHIELINKQVGIGAVANRNENPHQVHILGLLVDRGANAHTGDTAGVAEHFIEGLVPEDLDVAGFAALNQAIREDFLGAKFIAPVNHGDLIGDVGQVEGFLDRRVTAADHSHVLTLIKETIAGGAGGNPFAHECLFRIESQILGAGAGGNDQRIAGVAARVALQQKRPLF